jgi:hypothetical protein
MPETTSPTPVKRKAKGPQGPRLQGQASREAQRRAACILEVLGGARSPTDAAKALGLAVPRYYLLESRALSGLVDACEPRPLGRVRTPQSELASAQKELERLRRECSRYAALVRVAQRTVGLPAPTPKPAEKLKGKGKGRRTPAVRALKAAQLLNASPVKTETPASV